MEFGNQDWYEGVSDSVQRLEKDAKELRQALSESLTVLGVKDALERAFSAAVDLDDCIYKHQKEIPEPVCSDLRAHFKVVHDAVLAVCLDEGP